MEYTNVVLEADCDAAVERVVLGGTGRGSEGAVLIFEDSVVEMTTRYTLSLQYYE